MREPAARTKKEATHQLTRKTSQCLEKLFLPGIINIAYLIPSLGSCIELYVLLCILAQVKRCVAFVTVLGGFVSLNRLSAVSPCQFPSDKCLSISLPTHRTKPWHPHRKEMTGSPRHRALSIILPPNVPGVNMEEPQLWR